jgi:superfamily II DNA or RNA helicase
MTPQLDLLFKEIPEEKRGSEPVPEPVPNDVRDRFRNRSPNSPVVSRFQPVPLTGGEKSGTGTNEQGPLAQERVSASLSPCAGRGARGLAPAVGEERAVSESGTGPEPISRSRSEQRGLSDPKPPVPRPYQTAGIAAIDREWKAGKRSTLVVMPTGTGKTVVFSMVALAAVALGQRALVLAHRTELLEQAEDKLRAVGVRASIDQGANVGSLTAPVVIGSVQTLRGARLLRYKPDAFDVIIVDEAHHAPAKSYRSILEHFPGARVLGVTATPDRSDGNALSQCFESVAFTYEMRQAIREEFLVPLRAKRVLVRGVDLNGIKSHHGDFDQAELARVMAEEKALHGVVGPMLELAGDRKTLVFGVDVAHAKKLAEVINRHKPGAALAIDGSASRAERKAVLALFRAGRIQFLVNCALYTEGFDEPSIQCVALVRPTQSRALHTQMIGRVTRLLGLTYAESVANGKPFGLVLDFVGNSRHRLISPADALAGAVLGDTERAAAEAMLDGQTDLDAVLVHADEEAARKRAEAKLVLLAQYRTKEIDPFLGDFMPPLDPDAPLWRKPATEAQLAAIDKAGLGVPPPGLSLGEASLMLDAVAARRKAGLATIPQVRLLERMGMDTKGMLMTRASALMVKLASPPDKSMRFKPYLVLGEPEYRGKRRM